MLNIKSANILVTGGAGTLGYALARRRHKEGWNGKYTVYSTDAHKHEKMRREFPDIQFIQGDIRNADTLYNAMVGHDLCVHGAAVKIIPVSEVNSIDTYDINVSGSQCVCATALRAGIEHVVGVSTDKAAHPANAYGASKMLMEKTFQEYSRQGFTTQYHLVRLGNVLESNGSVIEAWKKTLAWGEKINITNAGMTRFWLSPNYAAEYVEESLTFPSGGIYIPKLKSLSIGKLAEYTVGEEALQSAQYVPVRPGEKIHECLLTEEEGWYVMDNLSYFLLRPNVTQRNKVPSLAYTSDMAEELTREELDALLAGG